jgi:hypothetical protein
VSDDRPTGLGGMTVEERMTARGLSDDWHRAVGARDREAMVRLLKRVALFDAAPIADAILGDPAAYGYE